MDIVDNFFSQNQKPTLTPFDTPARFSINSSQYFFKKILTHRIDQQSPLPDPDPDRAPQRQ